MKSPGGILVTTARPAIQRSDSSEASTLDLRQFLEALERTSPEDIVHVTEPVDPSRFGVTAVLQRLEDLHRFPLVVFDRPLDLNGETSPFPLVTNLYASRQRCALALGLRPDQAYQEL